REGEVVVEDRARIHGYFRRRRQIELVEGELLFPHGSQKLLDELHGEMLSSTAAIAKSEWRVTGCVAHGVGLTVDHSVDRAKRAVGHFTVASILEAERLLREGATGQPSLGCSVLVVVDSRRRAQIAIRVERLRV